MDDATHLIRFVGWLAVGIAMWWLLARKRKESANSGAAKARRLTQQQNRPQYASSKDVEHEMPRPQLVTPHEDPLRIPAWAWTGACVFVALSLMGVLRHQRDWHYLGIRWMTTLVAGAGVFAAFNMELYGWSAVLLALAIAYNPFHPFHFGSATWHVVDPCAAGTLVVAAAVLNWHARWHVLMSIRKWSNAIPLAILLAAWYLAWIAVVVAIPVAVLGTIVPMSVVRVVGTGAVILLLLCMPVLWRHRRHLFSEAGMTIIWLLVGIGIASCGCVTMGTSIYRLATATGRATARVVATRDDEREGAGGLSVAIVTIAEYNFTVAGVQYTGTSEAPQGGWTEGDTLKVSYDPQQPEHNRRVGDRDELGGPLMLLLLGGVLTIANAKGAAERWRA